MEYSFKKDMFSQETTYYVNEHSFGYVSSSEKKEWPLSNVTKVKLQFAPSRYNREKYVCHIHLLDKEKITLSNIHFAGFADFENRKESYNNFLKDFHLKLSNANKNVIYSGGNELSAYIAKLVFYGFLGLLFLGIGIAMFFVYVWIALVKIGFLIVLLPTVIKDIKSSKPIRYQPNELPPLLIPY